METITPSTNDTAARGAAIYETIKAILEPARKGEAVAINVENGEYVVASSPKEARALLHAKYPGIVSMSRPSEMNPITV